MYFLLIQFQVLLAVLIFYFQSKNSHNVHGKVQAEISENGEIYVKTPHELLDRINFKTSETSNSLEKEPPVVGPFVGNAEFVGNVQPHQEITVRKRDCEMPSIGNY